MERIVVKFVKTKGAKFISHLDTMRTIHRAIRRAGIPITYSKGFNPHASISVAAPLSLGIASTAEYADIEIDEHVDGNSIVEKLNNALPEGLRIITAVNIGEKMPSAMGIVEGALYAIALHCEDGENIAKKAIENILSSPEIFMNKRTKSGEKLVDIRPLIEEIRIMGSKDSKITFECLLHTGSRGSLGPEMLADLIKERSGDEINGYPDIVRKEIFTKVNNEWVDLLSYFS